MLASKLVIAQRLAICETCLMLTKAKRCLLCGCFVYGKTLAVNAKCPNNPSKWGEDLTTSPKGKCQSCNQDSHQT